jgi:hypothetical protein
MHRNAGLSVHDNIRESCQHPVVVTGSQASRRSARRPIATAHGAGGIAVWLSSAPLERTMSKTTKTTQDDTELLAMIQRHKAAWNEWDQLTEDDPRIDALGELTTDLARLIVVTPAHTPEALEGKRLIIEREQLTEWDDLCLIETIIELDAERVAAAY